jgi:hypothetical protein
MQTKSFRHHAPSILVLGVTPIGLSVTCLRTKSTTSDRPGTVLALGTFSYQSGYSELFELRPTIANLSQPSPTMMRATVGGASASALSVGCAIPTTAEGRDGGRATPRRRDCSCIQVRGQQPQRRRRCQRRGRDKHKVRRREALGSGSSRRRGVNARAVQQARSRTAFRAQSSMEILGGQPHGEYQRAASREHYQGWGGADRRPIEPLRGELHTAGRSLRGKVDTLLDKVDKLGIGQSRQARDRTSTRRLLGGARGGQSLPCGYPPLQRSLWASLPRNGCRRSTCQPAWPAKGEMGGGDRGRLHAASC